MPSAIRANRNEENTTRYDASPKWFDTCGGTHESRDRKGGTQDQQDPGDAKPSAKLSGQAEPEHKRRYAEDRVAEKV